MCYDIPSLFVENDDYLSPTEELVFIGNGPQEACTTVVVANDDHLEDTESFRVLIQSSVTRGISLDPDSTLVFIMGPEGEQFLDSLL